MKLHSLSPSEGSVKDNKRVGRGQGSGRGGTSTRGHKGQQSRSGYSRKIGFEGGQMPLQRRIPKFGFKNRNRVEYNAINLDLLQKLLDAKPAQLVDKQYLMDNGVIGKNDKVKILGRGELTSEGVEVKADAFSATAKSAIESKGGTATIA